MFLLGAWVGFANLTAFSRKNKKPYNEIKSNHETEVESHGWQNKVAQRGTVCVEDDNTIGNASSCPLQ